MSFVVIVKTHVSALRQAFLARLQDPHGKRLGKRDPVFISPLGTVIACFVLHCVS